MKVLIISCLLFSVISQTRALAQRGVNGGTGCVACTVLVGLAEQLVSIYNESVKQSLDRLCNYLPSELQVPCKLLVEEFGPGIIPVLEKKDTADIVCHGIGLCTQDTGEVCHLFPLPKRAEAPYNERGEHAEARYRVRRAIDVAIAARGRPFHKLASFCNLPVFKEICRIIERFGDNHDPLEDMDSDGYSDVHTFRGASWRGKDCNDTNPDVHPGRQSEAAGVLDSNCNGIYGSDASSGKTYEELWCKGTQPMGTVVLGDSVGAHFHIPPQWLTARDLSPSVFDNLLFILDNELDWPMLSAVTGYTNISAEWTKDIHGPVDSLYLRLRERNHCNHRDFQNLAVNGAWSFTLKDKLVKLLSRHPTLDYPMLMYVELVGNDVCDSHHDLTHMTTPQEFYSNMHASFKYIDSVAPKGSVVFTSGPTDGRVLYDLLHDHIHPIGSTNKDVTYSAFYDFLNCMQVSPCFGWMNSNGTWRNITTERAVELDKALQSLIANTTYNNITVHYLQLPISDSFDAWIKQGGQGWELIEPVDGFHPNQQANAITARIIWEKILKDFPKAIPPVNPHNDVIKKRFGDQGGY